MRPFLLNFTSVELQSFTMPARKQVEFIRGIFPHEMPHQSFLVLHRNRQGKRGFCKSRKTFLRQTGTSVMVESHNADFDNEDAKEAYVYVSRLLRLASTVAISI